jgi:hypothetical protein
LFSPFQKARPLGIQLFEKSKSRLSKLQPARRKSSAPVGNLYPRHIMLKGVFLKGDIRKSGGIIPIATKKPTETAFNLEWAPIILLRSRFELRSEMPTKEKKAITPSGMVAFEYRGTLRACFHKRNWTKKQHGVLRPFSLLGYPQTGDHDKAGGF